MRTKDDIEEYVRYAGAVTYFDTSEGSASDLQLKDW
jgi:hypothetical protein